MWRGGKSCYHVYLKLDNEAAVDMGRSKEAYDLPYPPLMGPQIDLHRHDHWLKT